MVEDVVVGGEERVDCTEKFMWGGRSDRMNGVVAGASSDSTCCKLFPALSTEVLPEPCTARLVSTEDVCIARSLGLKISRLAASNASRDISVDLPRVCHLGIVRRVWNAAGVGATS